MTFEALIQCTTYNIQLYSSTLTAIIKESSLTMKQLYSEQRQFVHRNIFENLAQHII